MNKTEITIKALSTQMLKRPTSRQVIRMAYDLGLNEEMTLGVAAALLEGPAAERPHQACGLLHIDVERFSALRVQAIERCPEQIEQCLSVLGISVHRNQDEDARGNFFRAAAEYWATLTEWNSTTEPTAELSIAMSTSEQKFLFAGKFLMRERQRRQVLNELIATMPREVQHVVEIGCK